VQYEFEKTEFGNTQLQVKDIIFEAVSGKTRTAS